MSKKERFGKYLILDHLVDGGMAKICRARYLGEQADKIVAIKMVQPQFSKDEFFKRMFMDEIKTTFGLLHPNIVQTYDYGINNGQLYVAMEYCDGRNLKDYLDKLKSKKFVFPVEISIYIVTQVCQGLHYAHTLTDTLTGKATNIIHRDISPHNIMLTYDGAIKVIDFGIAKSETNSEETQAGTIKGKLSYLAPEYLEGDDLDPRYDEFALGITLWEMLCSRKLFKAKNDLAILKKIQECEIPAPSSINPNVSKELDVIVLKALSRDRNLRYIDLDQLNRALIKFLYANYPDFNPSDLSYFAKELFKEEIKKDRENLYAYGNIDLRPYIDDLKRETGGASRQERTGNISTEKPLLKTGKESTATRKKISMLDFGYDKDLKTRNVPRKAAPKTKLLKSDKSPKPAKKLKKEELLAIDKMKGKRSNIDRALMIKNNSSIAINEKKVNDKQVRQSKGGHKFIYFIILLAISYYQKDYIMLVFKLKSPADKEVVIQDNIIEKIPAGRKGHISKIRFKNLNKSEDFIYVNNEKVRADYLSSINVIHGADLNVRIERRKSKHVVFKINLTKGEIYNYRIPSSEYMAYGYIKTSRACITGTLYLDVFDEKRVVDLPILSAKGIALPVKIDKLKRSSKKSYELFYKKDREDFQRVIKFALSENETVNLCDKL